MLKAAKSPIVFEKVIVLPLLTIFNECRAFAWLCASSLEPECAPSMSTMTLLAFGNREAQVDCLRGMSEVLSAQFLPTSASLATLRDLIQ